VVDSDDEYQEFKAFQEWKKLRQSAPALEKPRERTVKELTEEWLETLPKPDVYSRRRSQSQHFDREFNFRGQKVRISDLTPSQLVPSLLETWQLLLAATPKKYGGGETLTAGAADQIRMALQCMLARYVRLGEIPENPCHVVDRLEGRDVEREGYFTPAELKVFAAAMPTNGGWIYRHCFATGCRRDAIRLLTKPQIKWDDRMIVIALKGKKKRKGYIVVPDATLDEMRALCVANPVSEWVYPSPTDPRKAIPKATLAMWGRKARQATGIHRTLHETRHGCAMDMLAHNADITEVQAQLAHSSITQTARYARMRGQAIERLRKRQNDRFKGG
jgi:integrase